VVLIRGSIAVVLVYGHRPLRVTHGVTSKKSLGLTCREDVDRRGRAGCDAI
jgi:hypothetical protein